MEDHYGFKPEFSPPPPIQPPPAFSYPNYPQNPDLYPPLSDTSFSPPPVTNFTQNPANVYQKQAYRWVDSSTAHGTVPPSAVQGGVDADGHALYVGRAYHEDDLIPAKIIPGKNAAYVAHNGEEHEVEEYQILCKPNLQWMPSHAGHIPPGAVQGGHTSDGEPLYIGRAFHEGSQTIGKVHPSHGVCYLPFGGEEIATPEYEILVLRI